MKNWIDELEEEGLLNVKSDFDWLDERELEIMALEKVTGKSKPKHVGSYSKTPKGLLTSLSVQLKQTIKRKEMSELKWMEDVGMFKTWLNDNEEFHYLYDRWQKGNYLTVLKPTIQRIDSNKTFDLDNLKVVQSRDRKYEI